MVLFQQRSGFCWSLERLSGVWSWRPTKRTWDEGIWPASSHARCSCAQENGACAKRQQRTILISRCKIPCTELVFLCVFLCFLLTITCVLDMHVGLQGSKQFLQTNFKCVSCRAVASTVSSSLRLGANAAVDSHVQAPRSPTPDLSIDSIRSY